jgi:hypothetical protein
MAARQVLYILGFPEYRKIEKRKDQGNSEKNKRSRSWSRLSPRRLTNDLLRTVFHERSRPLRYAAPGLREIGDAQSLREIGIYCWSETLVSVRPDGLVQIWAHPPQPGHTRYQQQHTLLLFKPEKTWCLYVLKSPDRDHLHTHTKPIRSRIPGTVWWTFAGSAVADRLINSHLSEKSFFPYLYFLCRNSATDLVARIFLSSHSSGREYTRISATRMTWSTLLLAKHGISVDRVIHKVLISACPRFVSHCK